MVPQEATADRVSVEPVELIHDREQVSALVEVHAQEIDTLTPLGGTLLRACLQIEVALTRSAPSGVGRGVPSQWLTKNSGLVASPRLASQVNASSEAKL